MLKELEAIDGLRGLCIIYICFIHLGNFLGGTWPPDNPHIHALSRLAVEIFFCVSGLILFRSLSKDQHKLNFYMRRFFRIYPLWAIAVVCYWLRKKFSGGVALSLFSFGFGFLRYRNEFDPIWQSWSLFCEIAFYALLPFCFSFLKNLRRSLIFFAASILIAVAWQYGAPEIGVPTAQDFVVRFPLATFGHFFAGIVIYKLLNYIEKEQWLKWSVDAMVAILTYLAFFGPNLEYYGGHVWLVLTVVLASQVKGSLINRVCKLKLLRLYGINCYSIYLFHTLIYDFASPIIKQFLVFLGLIQADKITQMLAGLPLSLFLVVIFAELTRRLIETPIIKFGRYVNQLISTEKVVPF